MQIVTELQLLFVLKQQIKMEKKRKKPNGARQNTAYFQKAILSRGLCVLVKSLVNTTCMLCYYSKSTDPPGEGGGDKGVEHKDNRPGMEQ